MITQVQFGNIFSANGKTVLGGSSSGLDVESLVEGLVEAKRVPAVNLEADLETNASKVTAFKEMQDILNRFRDAADFLRNPPGVQNAASNIFKIREGVLTSNTTVSADTYASAVIEPGVTPQSFSITDITSLAQAKKQDSNDIAGVTDPNVDQAVFTVPGAGQFGAGTITVNGANITLSDGDTLQDVADAFNAETDTTGITAAVLQVTSGSYRLLFSAKDTGLSNDFDLSNPATVTADPSGVLTNITFTDRQAAADSSFKLDGITITRETNSIDDIIDGVTINLKQTTPVGTTLTLDIKPDTELVKAGIINFVDSYNELRVFTANQTLTNADGTAAEGALLGSNSSLRTVMNRVAAEVSRSVAGITSGDPANLSEIGITFDDFPGDSETPFTRNILVVDEDALQSALDSKFDEVRKVFEFDYTSDSSNLQVFSRTNSLNVSNISVDINITGSTYKATYDPGTGSVTVNLDVTTLSSGNLTLTGPDGSDIEGLVLIYNSTADQVVNLDITQGIGDRTFNALDDILDEDDGVVPVELEAFDDQATRIQKEIDRIDAEIERFREQLLIKFSALEEAVTQVNTLLQALDAQAQARQSS